jgi:glycosyltransferase involved in cell wall biosynthesis
MRTPLKFTCLIPVWGGDDAAHFTEAMSSLAASTRLPDDVLICQDGPAPEPLRAAVRTAARVLRARVVVNPGPRGLQHNLNHGLAAVRTPWVARFDADDVNLPGRFATQTAYLVDHPEVTVLGGTIVEFFPDGRSRRKVMPPDHARILRFARWRNPINHMTAMFHIDAVRAVGGYPDIPFKEDYGLWLKLLGAGARFANLPDDLVRARLGDEFHRRRAGLRNLGSEVAIHALKRRVPGMGALPATAALAARSAALALAGPARLAYEWGLRR